MVSCYLPNTIQDIEGAGFEITTEKIQCTCPWTYLGLWIGEWTIVPQQLAIKDNPRTLRDLHQLCGTINWVCTLLRITTEDLTSLFNLLRGSDDLNSSRTITLEAQEVIRKVSEVLSTRQAHPTDPALPFQFVILGDMLLVEEADYNLLGRDLIVALGINLIVRDSRIVVSIYKLTCEDEDKINPKVWHTGREAGRLDMNPISVEIERPEDPIRIKQYPIPLEGRRGLKPIIEDLINKGIL
ncbi:hypothetical protein DUI87_03351 [Hirundo rustica rustica]|uniref:Reverse transcriptase thumb domain-containing protein n=1 Tax=Hirundo rustica rustica TaxID=333673 RepID=A0A3M0LKZ0_HIRRU|nr:hypothetical protein DUI87_03351 [Hirundo rustica rustica]